jgi:8-oxo-dGTP diphosphatase
MSQTVHVAVGVITKDNLYFLTKRLLGGHQGGKWEFPGGKVEKDESVHQALHRELKEEVAIEVLSCIPLIEITHDYGDKKVLLEVFIIDNFSGQAKALEGQESNWFTLGELAKLEFPAANQAIIAKLNLQNGN